MATKKTSFQITSVTVDSSASNDGADDSADDLDESHTEDSSDVATDASRHTSESRGVGATGDDNFTRNDVFFNPAPPSSISSAPVIPTSSQYGLAIVSGNEGPVIANSDSPPGPGITAPDPNLNSSSSGEKTDHERDHVHNRFKVVKIVSTEPFKKGRWMCMDYFDHTTTSTSSSATSNVSLKDSISTNPQPQTQGSPPHQQVVPQQLQQQIPQLGTEQHGLNMQQQQMGNDVVAPTVNSSPPHQITPQTSQTAIGESQQQQQQQQHVLQQQQQQQPLPMQQHGMQILSQSELQDNSNNGTAPNGLNNGSSYHHMNHVNVNNLGHNVHSVNSMGEYVNHNIVPSQTSSNIPNIGVYQNTQPPQQQQQQYYAGSAIMQGNLGPKPTHSAQTQTLTQNQGGNQTQQPRPIQQQQQQQPQSINLPTQQQMNQYNHDPAIGPNSNASNIIPQCIHPTRQSQMQQQQPQPQPPQQQQQLPAQSLPHGAVTQMTLASMGTAMPNVAASSANSQQQQQQPHAAQSLGHGSMQSTPNFLPQAQQQQQQPQQTQPQFQQQQPQQMNMTTQPQVQAQLNMPQQQQQQQQPQGQSQQQNFQPQPSQVNLMMSGIPNMQHQQHHNMQPLTSNQVPMQMQVPQSHPGTQGQAIYSQQPQIHHNLPPMTNQPQQLPLTTPQQQMMPQQQQTQPPQMMQSQPQLLQQGHHMVNQQQQQQQLPQQQLPQQQQLPPQQQAQNHMMTMPQQHSIVSQAPSGTQQSVPQMAPQQVIQYDTQMNTMVSQSHSPQMVPQTQQGLMSQNQGMMSQPSSSQQQQPMMQSIPQTTYQGQAQNVNQNPMTGNLVQQPMMHQQNFQQQPQNTIVQQQPMLNQQQPNALSTQMNQGMPSSQQQHGQPMQVVQGTTSQMNMPQQQQQQQPPVYPPQSQNVQSTQNIQSAQSNLVPNMTSMQPMHTIIPPVASSTSQMGVQLPPGTNSMQQMGGTLEMNSTSSGLPGQSEHYDSSQQQQQQQQQQPVQQQQQQQPVQQQPTGVTESHVTLLSTAQSTPSQHQHQQNGPSTASSQSGINQPNPGESMTNQSKIVLENGTIQSVIGSDDGDTASGTNTVAIDNKIEQAMDLVKSHLMFAVREEVEVLKEKISELMERINQLEYENTILKANATQETLAQLHSAANSNSTNNPNT